MQPEVQAVDALQQELEKQKELAKRHLDGWKRAAADLENYRKRVEKEHAELVRFGHAALMMQLLPVLDDLERAFQTLPAGLSSFTWIEGLALIDRKLRVALESQGLKEIEAFGKPFDPLAHEAVLQQERHGLSRWTGDRHTAKGLQTARAGAAASHGPGSQEC